ncbi:MAG TPA: hypothetical protein VFT67_08090 [Jatrophihabitantaceae bacterium]|nr:hypothetical protein [Jatrophihabitantaceae bacterium]
MGRTRSVAGLLLATATVAGLLTACSSTGHDTSPNSPATSSASASDAVAAAYARTTAASSAKFGLSADVTGGPVKQPIHVTAAGVIDFAHRTSDLTAQLPGAGQVEVRYLAGILYAKLPASLAAMLPGGKAGNWISLDLNALSQQQLGTSLQQLEAAAPSDPSQVLSFLRGAGTGVTDAGPATVGGIATTRYTTTIDLDKAAAELPAKARAGLARLEQNLGTHKLPAQLWIDGQGRLRRMTITAQQGQLTLTLSHFGTPVHVTAPPADRTTDVTALISGGH